MSRGIGVHCAMSDCLYHANPRGSMCTCTHPEKTHYLTKDSCPLYRMDWARATDRVAQLRKQFRVKTTRETFADKQRQLFSEGCLAAEAARPVVLAEQPAPLPLET